MREVRPACRFVVGALVVFVTVSAFSGSIEAEESGVAAIAATDERVNTPTWTQVSVCAGCHIDIDLGTSLWANTLYSWTAGLRMVGGNFNHNIRWALQYTDNLDVETAFTFRWYTGEADWLSLEFVTTSVTTGQKVFVTIVNVEGPARTMEYTHLGKIIRGGLTRTPTTDTANTRALIAYSGLTAVYWTPYPYLAADTMYVFNVLVTLSGGDATQQVAWLFRCYRPSGTTEIPSNVGQSRHHERWGDNAWTNIMWPSRASGSYCGLWINNWDPNGQTFYYRVTAYTAGSVSRTTVHNGESGACRTLVAGELFTATLISLPTGSQYMAYARVLLVGGAGGDVDHRTAWNTGLLNAGTGGDGIRQGYKLRFWTDFDTPYNYNPWVEGSVVSTSLYYNQDFTIYIRNADSTSRQWCYYSSAVSF